MTRLAIANPIYPILVSCVSVIDYGTASGCSLCLSPSRGSSDTERRNQVNVTLSQCITTLSVSGKDQRWELIDDPKGSFTSAVAELIRYKYTVIARDYNLQGITWPSMRLDPTKRWAHVWARETMLRSPLTVHFVHLSSDVRYGRHVHERRADPVIHQRQRLNHRARPHVLCHWHRPVQVGHSRRCVGVWREKYSLVTYTKLAWWDWWELKMKKFGCEVCKNQDIWHVSISIFLSLLPLTCYIDVDSVGSHHLTVSISDSDRGLDTGLTQELQVCRWTYLTGGCGGVDGMQVLVISSMQISYCHHLDFKGGGGPFRLSTLISVMWGPRFMWHTLSVIQK